MEQENLRLGRARGFQGIFTTNANRLTQLISRSLDYQILSSIQVEVVEHTQTLITEKKNKRILWESVIILNLVTNDGLKRI